MAAYWETLRRSLVDRASALDRYLESLGAGSARSDAGFALALRTCRAYTKAVRKQVSRDWEDAVDDDERAELLGPLLRTFLKNERWIDQRFARGSQHDVPRALKTIARQEFASLGLLATSRCSLLAPPAPS